ncbi:YozQ family protein [Brevibacillus ginsengisoli]|uniref:YozQ family protein n=1 Tax=Brevibacillus ginsengisoli TaxID=363854 RepID=UPI003CF117A0
MDQQQANQSLQENAAEVAGRTYQPSDYEKQSTISQGLATTHEQVSDNYMEGTNDGTIDEYDGEKNVSIPRTGYDEMFTDQK